MYRNVYIIMESPHADHCAECGGEENEVANGTLGQYLVVEVSDEVGRPKEVAPLLERYYEMTICEGCADAIHNLSKPKVVRPGRVSRVPTRAPKKQKLTPEAARLSDKFSWKTNGEVVIIKRGK